MHIDNNNNTAIRPKFSGISTSSGGRTIQEIQHDNEEEEEKDKKRRGCDCITGIPTTINGTQSFNDSSFPSVTADASENHLIGEPQKLESCCECPTMGERNDSNNTTERNDTKGKINDQSSAYVQNLAEISYDILHDSRWRVMNKQLFQWERGDDMSALIYLSRLFLTKEQRFESNIRNDHDDVQVLVVGDDHDGDDDRDDEIFARCMNLYSRLFYRKGPWFQIQVRLFYRKGPWFQIQDVFIRYYHRDYVTRQKHDQASQRQPCSSSNEVGSETFEEFKNSVARCIEDLCRLHKIGLIRTFLSEEECGCVIGESGSNILTEKDKMNLLCKLGAKSSKDGMVHSSMRNVLHRTENVFLQQMKSQKSIMLFSINQKKQKVLPIKRHVDSIIISNWCLKLIDFSTANKCNNDDLTDQYLKTMWQSVASDLKTNINLFTCFRLRERPLETLRRACRLYLCAGDGPGSMRFTGANAWIPTRETNENAIGLRHQEQRTLLKGICNLPEPPTSSLWHQVEFHGLKHRMGLSHYNFMDNYSRVPATLVKVNLNDEKKIRNWIEIFCSHSDFHLWELCAEIRCVVDYLIEWNRIILYADRKLKAKSKDGAIKHTLKPCIDEQFCLLSVHIRANFLRKLLIHCGFDTIDSSLVEKRVEAAIQHWLHERSSPNEAREEKGAVDVFQTDSERLIVVLSIICHQVLIHRLQKISHDDIESFLKRPWLRHLHPESVLAYIIWDCIDIIERRNLYDLATAMLETILFGFHDENQNILYFQDYIHGTIDRPMISHFTQLLLSRRVRGKAFERLFIDKKHVSRQQFQKTTSNKSKKRKVCNELDTFTTQCIHSVTSVASVPFSFIRKFCRRLKMPILRLLGDIWSIEMLELGIRLHETSTHEKAPTLEEEWTPKTDVSIANALICDENKTGKRCSFVSSEESDGAVFTRSLNVEELAMEEYMAGRLPKEKNDAIHKPHVGKWTGWHCEGVHVRVLFRLLCHSLLLGNHLNEQHEGHLEQLTVFLNAFQAAPLDLHVAHAALAKDA
eukprot:CAMPEP_0176502548 /NCGR_PEP_ID=MMETSP0200_2-20121128/14814_1 /TAXON_ID=947934 /ORGANISM="Chaetoceros sp., Strain GSL56" /LENGTH=1028 /DNA_ID=CAMNT_0017901631 /DNA_START=111 /DNA_END=3193 /DNA_ORIENTATION=-